MIHILDRLFLQIRWFLYKRLRDKNHNFIDKICPHFADKTGHNVLWYNKHSVEKRSEGGYVSIGDNCRIEGKLICHQPSSRIIIGSRCSIGGGSVIESLETVIVGDDCLISSNVRIQDHNSHALEWEYRQNDVLDWIENKKIWNHVKQSDVVIGAKSWIGTRCIILKGVNLGEGSIVGAGSVVTHSFPPFSIIAGNPARLIRIVSE